MKTIIHIIKKEFQQFSRDPKMFGIVLIAPIIQLIFLGYAANLDVNDIRFVLLDQSKSSESREYIGKINHSGYFTNYSVVENYDEAVNLIDNGKVSLAIIIPSGFGKNLKRNETATVQAIFDGSNGNSALIAAGYLGGISADYNQKLMTQMLERSGRKLQISRLQPEGRVWYNPEMKTRVFMVPGIAGLILMMITLILTSLAIVKEKESGTLEQLVVTPIKPIQLIIGKLVPFAIVGLATVLIVLTAMQAVFNIELRGSFLLLFFASFAYILSTLGLGLFVSTISKTQQQAMMASIFLIMLPMVYLSGFAFPLENMPKIIQYISVVIPLKYYMVIIRGIVLKGIGFAELWGEIVILLGMGISILILSSLRFRKKLE